MMKMFTAVLLALLLSACSALSLSPEAQIKAGGNSAKATAVVGTVLLKNDKITAVQGRGYINILNAAAKHLDDAEVALTACRKRTNSTQATSPDPCKASVADDIKLGISIAEDVQRTLDAKK